MRLHLLLFLLLACGPKQPQPQLSSPVPAVAREYFYVTGEVADNLHTAWHISSTDVHGKTRQAIVSASFDDKSPKSSGSFSKGREFGERS